MIGSDLDGTVRQPISLFDKGRDNSRYGIIRVVYGLFATIFAKRINKEINADVYITGSPAYENGLTKIWLKLHGMSTKVDGNALFSRRLYWDWVFCDPQEGAMRHKAKMINYYKVTKFYENDPEQAKYLKKHTNAEIILVGGK